MKNLFETFAHPEDTSPPDDTHIVQVLLYYSVEEAVEFKKLCKAAMKKHYENFQQSNQSDLILKLLRDASKPDNERRPSAEVVQDVPW